MQSLGSILAALPAASQRFSYQITADWLQGRTVFGGLIAALANSSVRSQIASDRPLRALQVVYVGPNAMGAVEFEPRVLRAGKSVILSSCTVRSQGEVTATVTGMYGAGRQSMLNVRPTALSLGVTPTELKDVPLRADMPAFLQHYQQRWARGAPLFSRATDSPMSVYLRYRAETTARMTEAHALALMDAIPTPALALLDKASPSSTLSWTLEILDDNFDFGMDEWWRLDADVDAAADGYVVHSSHVVNPAGRVAAISRQVVVIYG